MAQENEINVSHRIENVSRFFANTDGHNTSRCVAELLCLPPTFENTYIKRLVVLKGDSSKIR